MRPSSIPSSSPTSRHRIRAPSRSGSTCEGRELATHGWTKGSGRTIEGAVDELADAGASAFVVTQIAVDGMLVGPDLELYGELLARTGVPVIASGGIGSVEHLQSLAQLRARGSDRALAGAIAGKAIYERRFTVEEGIAACSQ